MTYIISLSKEHPPKIGIMQSKASGQGKTLPCKRMKCLWDEKLPRNGDKGHHEASGSLDPTLCFGVLEHAAA